MQLFAAILLHFKPVLLQHSAPRLYRGYALGMTMLVIDMHAQCLLASSNPHGSSALQEAAGAFAALRDGPALHVEAPRPVDLTPECAGRYLPASLTSLLTAVMLHPAQLCSQVMSVKLCARHVPACTCLMQIQTHAAADSPFSASPARTCDPCTDHGSRSRNQVLKLVGGSA